MAKEDDTAAARKGLTRRPGPAAGPIRVLPESRPGVGLFYDGVLAAIAFPQQEAVSRLGGALPSQGTPLVAGAVFAGTGPLVPMPTVDGARVRGVMRRLDAAVRSGESAETAMTGVELLHIAADENPRVVGALIAGATAVCVVDPHTAEAFFRSLRLLGLM